MAPSTASQPTASQAPRHPTMHGSTHGGLHGSAYRVAALCIGAERRGRPLHATHTPGAPAVGGGEGGGGDGGDEGGNGGSDSCDRPIGKDHRQSRPPLDAAQCEATSSGHGDGAAVPRRRMQR
eukprot:146021-Chlamydomonas_euryale.AAC.1